MVEFLEFLTAKDRERLLDAAQRRMFAPGEVILREGEARHAIFVIHSGEARVERSHTEFDVEIARLNAGEIFGEMGFIEGFEASASVVADTDCDVAVVDAEHVNRLIAEDPGFYGRFYQSLAVILSRRLRETTDIGIAEYAWGGRPIEDISLLDVEAGSEGWGGGSPLRDETL